MLKVADNVKIKIEKSSVASVLKRRRHRNHRSRSRRDEVNRSLRVPAVFVVGREGFSRLRRSVVNKSARRLSSGVFPSMNAFIIFLIGLAIFVLFSCISGRTSRVVAVLGTLLSVLVVLFSLASLFHQRTADLFRR
jgi:hypothetical protein